MSASPPQLTLLGGFGLRVNHETAPLTPSSRRLVALLALHGSALGRGYVAGLLWGDSTEARASGCLRSALWKLRAAGLGVVGAYGDSLTLSPDVGVDIRQVTNLARSVVAGGLGEEAFALLDPCFSAELLPGWHDEWVLGARERHRQLILHALELLCEHLTSTGRYGASSAGQVPGAASATRRRSAARDTPLRSPGPGGAPRARAASGAPA